MAVLGKIGIQEAARAIGGFSGGLVAEDEEELILFEDRAEPVFRAL